MREIKFRAWDNVKNKMYYTGIEDEVVISFDSGGLIATDLTEHDWGFKKLEHLKYMQYTGLKDKNGNEIYEGDIVKGKAYEFNGCPRIIGEIVYDYCEYKVKGRREKTHLMKAELNTTYEVIGNIYDNPSLLEES